MHFGHCVKDLLYGDRLRGISRLKGCSIERRSSDSDFLAGFLIGLNVLESLGTNEWSLTRARVLEAARCGSIITDTHLYLAEGGRVSRSLNRIISALDRGEARDVRRWTETLLAAGGVSAADTAVGFYMTVREGLARRLRRPAVSFIPSTGHCRYDVV
jgi:hypothetical protein